MYKTWLVANGYKQREGTNFNQVFSLVVNVPLFVPYLSWLIFFDSELKQLDLKIALLHGELEEPTTGLARGIYF